MAIFSSKESYVGIDIGAGGIKLVELRKTKGRPQLWTYGIVDHIFDVHTNAPEQPTLAQVTEIGGGSNPNAPGQKNSPLPMPISPEQDEVRIHQYAAYIKELVKRARVTTRRAAASLPVSHVFHAVITLPKVPEKELEHHLLAKIKKVLPRPVEEMQVIHQILRDPTVDKAKEKNMKILVTAAPSTLVSFYSRIFSEAGLELSELETEAFALVRSLVGLDPAVSMVVDIGAERTNFFIVERGVPVTHRTIQVGGDSINRVLQTDLGVEGSYIEQIKRDVAKIGGDTKWFSRFGPTVDPLIKEIQYSVDLFLHQSGNENKRPQKIILTGGAAFFPPIASLIQAAFPMKVFVGDPWARVVYQQELKTVLDSIGPRMSVAIGLAMHHIV